jgi:outer membrane immunogenic protein
MKRIFLTIALLIFAAGRVFAADLPPPQAPVAYIPGTVAVYNWGGIYAGINGGYAFGSSDWTGGIVSSGSFSTSGPVFGGTVGANWQTDAFVFGLESDLDYAHVKGDGPSGFCAGCTTSSTWLGTARGRIGYAADRILFYGTAGAAYGNVQAAALGVDNSSTELGWTAGGGVEAAFSDNWTARLEYLFVDLGHGSCTSACGAPPSQSVSFNESLIRAGIDFKFRP